MESNCFVIEITKHARYGVFNGPYTWNQAFERIITLLRYAEQIILTEDEITSIEATGEYNLIGGGGYYIVTPE